MQMSSDMHAADVLSEISDHQKPDQRYRDYAEGGNVPGQIADLVVSPIGRYVSR
jgi:hypothetical protein